MPASRHPFERFLRRAHRRYALLRLCERAGLGVLGGCAAGLPLVAVLAYRGADALEAAAVALAVGAAAGILWGWLTRPSPMATALEADRQLRWADLLGSAMLVRARSADDPFAAAVLAEADARCRGTTPDMLIFHRLGARTWGGIGLASALVLVLGLLPTFATPSQADEHRIAARNPLALLEPEQPPASEQARTFSHRSHRQEDPDDPNASRMGSENVPSARQSESTGDGDGHSTHAGGASNHGTGASQTNSPQPGQLNAAPVATDAQSTDGVGKATGGAGRAVAGSGNGAPSGQSAGPSSTAPRQSPPWQSSDWPARSKQAIDAVETGRLPDAYRDVIRQYFEQP